MQIWFYILIIAAIILILLFLLCGYIYNQIAWRNTFKLPKFIEKIIAGNTPEGEYEKFCAKAEKNLYDNYPLELIEITTSDGATLRAKLLKPKKPNGKIILACHGARSDGVGEFCKIAPYLYEHGYTIFLPDHRGCGSSTGKFMGYGTHESKDTFLWLESIEKRFPSYSIFLYGISMGAATVLMMSDKADRESIKGIIADCSYTSAWDEFSYQIKESFHLPNFPILNICDLYSKIFAGYSFKTASPLECVKNAKKPVLFIHGKADDYVPYYMMDILYNACPTEKYKVTVEGAFHARSYYQNHIQYETEMEKFIEKCMKL